MQQQENSIQDHDLFDLLRERVEQVVDRKMKTPKDYDYLSKSILEKQHENISATTLKRMWGYLSEPVKPRISTLDILAGYVGAESWEDFCRQEQVSPQTIDDEPESSDDELKAADDESQKTAHIQQMTDVVPDKKGPLPWKRITFIVLPLLLIIGLCAFLYFQSKSNMFTFADPAVKALCVAHWDTDGDGELSYEEAALVTDLEDVFCEDTTITSFNELQYFTGLASIGECAFIGCSNLTSIILPNQVKSIDAHAFAGCSTLTSIIFPDNVTRIDMYAFLDCTSLVELHIPQSVTHIGGAAFNGTSSVTNITVDERNPIYDSRNNCNAIIETAANKLVAGCCTTVIPTDVTIIDNDAWGGCWSLKSIRLPKNIRRIEHGAFNWAITLNAVVSEIKVPFQFEEEAFDHIGGECTLTVPHGTRDAYIAAGWTEEIFKGGIMEANE